MSTQPQNAGVSSGTNGLAVASLVTGIVGAVTGLIPLLFIVAFICGAVAVGLGIPAIRAAGVKGRKVMAWFGTVLGVIAIVLAIVGVAVVNDAFEDVDRELDRIEREVQ